MKSLYLPFTALLAAAVSAYSTPDIQLNNHFKIDFSVLRGNSRSPDVKGARERMMARGDLFELPLDNDYVYYFATLKVGANGDENNVMVDTGSSDLWITSSDVSCFRRPYFKRGLEDSLVMQQRTVYDFEDKNSGLQRRDNHTATDAPGKIDDSLCKVLGSFSTEASGSFYLNSTAPDFMITYEDTSYAKGVWRSDYVSIGSLNVSECNFAVVNETNSDVGVLGIGLPDLEVTVDTESPYTYENFPIRLKSIGAIKKVAYSLYLNDVDSMTGSVLFGAVDHAKYSGQLQTVPLVNLDPRLYDHPSTFHIVLNSVTLGDGTQEILVTNSSSAALLDSGTGLSYLPKNMVESIAKLLNGEINEEGYYEVDCIYNTSSAHVDFNFTGVHIKVPLSDVIMRPEGPENSKCYLGLKSHREDNSILGDNFLRHAYVVYDLEQYEISLAQVNYSDTENIEIISSSVPLAVKAPGYYSTTLANSIETQSSIERLTLATTASYEIGSETSATTVNNSGSSTGYNVTSYTSVASNGTNTSSSSYVPNSSFVTNSKGGSSSLSIILAVILIPILACL